MMYACVYLCFKNNVRVTNIKGSTSILIFYRCEVLKAG